VDDPDYGAAEDLILEACNLSEHQLGEEVQAPYDRVWAAFSLLVDIVTGHGRAE
jgi:hypothetical protein